MIKLNPYEFIDLANKLVEDQDYLDEPRYRTVISRIYYGTIHLLMLIKKISIRDINRFHYELIQKLKLIDISLGGWIENLKEKRVKADYYLNQRVGKSVVEEAYKLFKRIEQKIDEY
ncbi:MAG: hypothetical protein BAJALOKI1v1_1100011 [Promethearchaeota archaeon]|nr:MAG: hypothetical protein BAJALOKI1v1_1100011 [Candidatus Lokiarchaeota archaeon]